MDAKRFWNPSVAVGLAGLGLAAGQVAGQPALSNETAGAGLVATHMADLVAIPAAQEWQTGGLAVEDFNNDGSMDIFWIGGGLTADKLFMNNGAGGFVDLAAAWGIADLHCGNGAAAGDYNGDGWVDLYVTSFGAPGAEGPPGAHRLYRNDSGTGFTNVAADAGVNYSCPQATNNPSGYGAAFGDYDLDGNLDLCVVSWWGDSELNPGGDDGTRLYHNKGDGTFEDVTDAALGGAVHGIWGFQPAFADMDGDRYPELLISADFETSRYLVNNADGTFTDMTVASGTGLDDNGMGQTVADFANNGKFDWYVTSVYSPTPPPDHPGNMLYLSQGGHSYIEAAGFAGVLDGRWGWGTIAIDLDHDTWLDILEVNGRDAAPYANQPARLWRNNGGFFFTEMAAAAGFDHADEGRGIAYLDADNDGDLDVVVSTNAGPLAYYVNQTPDIGAWLRIKLDTGNNPTLAPNGFGTRVLATVGGNTYRRIMNSSPSYLATSELRVHFGLGDATVVDTLRFEWAKGYVTEMTDVAVNQQMTVQAPQLGDIDADGAVGVVDLLGLLGGWGPCPAAPAPCLADLDNDGQIGVTDLLVILANWSL